eukprot:UN13307
MDLFYFMHDIAHVKPPAFLKKSTVFYIKQIRCYNFMEIWGITSVDMYVRIRTYQKSLVTPITPIGINSLEILTSLNLLENSVILENMSWMKEKDCLKELKKTWRGVEVYVSKLDGVKVWWIQTSESVVSITSWRP